MPQNDSLLVDGQILLYGDVGDPWGWGDGFTPTQVARALAETGPGPVTVRLNSGGGVAFDGMAIFSLLRAHDGPVTMVIDGIAASAASLIAMAGDTIEMRRGAMMMIHDAAGMTFGNADEHGRAAAVLDTLSQQYAGVYAQRAGISTDAVRTLMKAETWLSADDALAGGFASTVRDDDAAPVAAFDYAIYARAPAGIPVRRAPVRPLAASAALSTSSAAPAALAQEGLMPAPETATAADDLAVTAPAAVASQSAPAVKAWAVTAYGLADRAGLTLMQANSLVQASASLEQFKDAVIDAIATPASERPRPGAGAAVVLADGRDKFREGITNAVLSMAGLADRDPANEFNGISPMGIALAVLSHNGVKAAFDKTKFVAAAITHTSSDFAQITANIMDKAMMKGFDEQQETFPLWTSKGILTDFKQGKRVGLNAIPSLQTIGEAGEFTYLTTGDRAEPVQLVTAGGIISLTRQAIINDDLGAFIDVPRKLGRAAKRTIGDTVYAILLTNPVMSDAVALFHTSHKNTATGSASALSVTSLIAASTAMGLQVDRSATATALNIDPAYLICSRALAPFARQLMGSTAEVGSANAGVANRVANMATVVADARIDRTSNGSTKWFLAGDPNMASGVEVQYLNGVESPYIEQGLEFDVDGVRLKVRHDFGAKALQWEPLYYAAGQ